ncbi:MAG: hypothetical protein AB7O74_15030 [Candidatus Nanopelagicales bacterium]|uniref:hypothetical protein n=1 Tax=Pseudonocardia sp. TaxID=60912 RepID=UPI003D0FEB4A
MTDGDYEGIAAKEEELLRRLGFVVRVGSRFEAVLAGVMATLQQEPQAPFSSDGSSVTKQLAKLSEFIDRASPAESGTTPRIVKDIWTPLITEAKELNQNRNRLFHDVWSGSDEPGVLYTSDRRRGELHEEARTIDGLQDLTQRYLNLTYDLQVAASQATTHLTGQPPLEARTGNAGQIMKVVRGSQHRSRDDRS